MAISLFFNAVGHKFGTASSPDSRRRLALLLYGTAMSLTPVWSIVLYGLWSGAPPFAGVPDWISIPVILMLFLFPVTLAYVIVVHRALDVRVVIRQGVQYAFARRGVQVLRWLVFMGIQVSMSWLLSQPNTRQVDILRILAGGWWRRWRGGSRIRSTCRASRCCSATARRTLPPTRWGTRSTPLSGSLRTP